MNLYRSKEWRAFRAEKIRRDCSRCAQCQRGLNDGAVLQVHHLHYVIGLKPWEYLFEECMTLCKGCHAAAHGILVPVSGWDQIWWDDLDALDGECDFCGTQIRYVFTLFHPNWPPLDVGCDCCDRLTETDVASEQLRKLRLASKRRSTFIRSPKWALKDRIYYISVDHCIVSIAWVSNYFFITVEGVMGRKKFGQLNEAKGAVFDIIANGELKQFIDKLSR